MSATRKTGAVACIGPRLKVLISFGDVSRKCG
jgi:hypothetical protein